MNAEWVGGPMDGDVVTLPNSAVELNLDVLVDGKTSKRFVFPVVITPPNGKVCILWNDRTEVE